MEKVYYTMSSKHLSNILAFIVIYIIAFYVPATDVGGRYYQVSSGFSYFINIYVLLAMLAVLLALSTIKIILMENTPVQYGLYFLGLYMIAWNVLLSVINSPSDYNVMGFLFCAAPSLWFMRPGKIYVIITGSLAIIVLFTMLTFIDNVSSGQFNPVVEKRYFELMGGEGFRLANTSLYGQKNAAGAAISTSIMFMFYLFLNDIVCRYKAGTSLLLVLAGLVLVTTYSAGGILVFLVATLYYLYQFRKTVNNYIVAFLFLITLACIVLYGYMQFSSYKLASIGAKFDRIGAYIDYVTKNGDVLIFGENVFRLPGSVSYYTESAFLDFSLNFGMIFSMVILFFIIYFIYVSRMINDRYAVFMLSIIVILMMIQNSSLMPANLMLLFLILRVIDYKRSGLHLMSRDIYA